MPRAQAIDAHIHLDRIDPTHRQQFMRRLQADRITQVIAVAVNAQSCQELLSLRTHYPHQVVIAFGYHPEQPWDATQAKYIQQLIRQHHQELVAIGEVGLPYYSLPEAERKAGESARYIARVEPLVALAKELDLPLVLHAIHEAALPMFDLLQQCGIHKAHFHWFKAPPAVVTQVVEAGYYVSVTPEVCYRQRDQELVLSVPSHLLLVETDAPWQYAEQFQSHPTEPKMVWQAIHTIAKLWKQDEAVTAQQLWENTQRCYGLLVE
jgi:TatD DNase family protein